MSLFQVPTLWQKDGGSGDLLVLLHRAFDALAEEIGSGGGYRTDSIAVVSLPRKWRQRDDHRAHLMNLYEGWSAPFEAEPGNARERWIRRARRIS